MFAYTMFLQPEPEIIPRDPGHPVQRGFNAAQPRPAPPTNPPPTTIVDRSIPYRDVKFKGPPRNVRVHPKSNPPGYRPRERPVRLTPVFSPQSAQEDQHTESELQSWPIGVQPDNFPLVDAACDGEIKWGFMRWWPVGIRRDYHLACTIGEPWPLPPIGPQTTPILPPKHILPIGNSAASEPRTPPTPELIAGGGSSSSSTVSSLPTPVTPDTATVPLAPEHQNEDDEWETIEIEDAAGSAGRADRENVAVQARVPDRSSRARR